MHSGKFHCSSPIGPLGTVAPWGLQSLKCGADWLKKFGVVDQLYFALLIGTGFCLFMSLRTLFVPNRMRGGSILSLENFLYLGMVYFTVLVGFGMVYLLFGLYAEPVLQETGGAGDGSFFKKAGTAVYFSAMTLFSVGHGDVVPLGAGRFVAILEALVGYTIPAAFVARAVLERD